MTQALPVSRHGPSGRLAKCANTTGRRPASGGGRPLIPGLMPAIDADAPARQEFGGLDLKATDSLATRLDKRAVIELLQQQMARIVVEASSGMIVGVIEEHFKGGAVMDVGAWIKFETEHTAAVAGIVEERPPAAGEFLKASSIRLPAGRGRSGARQDRWSGRERCASFADASIRLQTYIHAVD
jgi:hypothetical protein